MPDKPIRYAIIGCGDHARRHVENMRGLTDFLLVGAFDPDKAQMSALARTLGRPFVTYGDVDSAFKDDTVDAVLVASPDAFHISALELAVEYGKHALIEKPLATTRDDCKKIPELLEAADKQGKIITSCHPRRFDPPYLWLKSRLSRLKHQYGGVLSIDLDFSYHESSKKGLHTGLLMDHVNHEFDFVNFLFGHVETRLNNQWDLADVYRVTGFRADGIALTFNGTRLLTARRYPETVRMRFCKADFELRCDTGMVRINDHETGAESVSNAKPTDHALRLRDMMAHFAKTIRGTEQNYLSPLELHANTAIGVELTESQNWIYNP